MSSVLFATPATMGRRSKEVVGCTVGFSSLAAVSASITSLSTPALRRCRRLPRRYCASENDCSSLTSVAVAAGSTNRSFATNQKKYRNRKRNQPPPHLLPKSDESSEASKDSAATANKAPTTQQRQRPLGLGLNIEARPPGEKEYHSKIALPDLDKEKELGRLQNTVMEHHRGGDYRRGLKSAQDLYKATAIHFGVDHPATAAAHNNVGLLQKLLGDFIEARASYEAARRIYRRSALGMDHQSYATTLHNLGNLNRHQIHLDETLSATDRLGLVEDALEYLKQAHAIRLAELGPLHPHTVTSRSAWGATLAVQILHQHKLTETAAKEGNHERKRFYVSLLPTELTENAWEAAAEHLTAALETAVQHPRGTTVTRALNQRDNAAKPLRPSIEQAAKESPLPTLSAAAAAQNLAVFYKTRATTVTPHNETWLREAEKLYKQVLIVQAVILHDKHPDMYATKHSLAELLQALGDEETANALRQEMVDTYDPPPAPPREDTPLDEVEVSQTSHHRDSAAGDNGNSSSTPPKQQNEQEPSSENNREG